MARPTRSPERGIALGGQSGGCTRVSGRQLRFRMLAGGHPQTIATKVLPPRCVGLIERPRLLELVTQVQTSVYP